MMKTTLLVLICIFSLQLTAQTDTSETPLTKEERKQQWIENHNPRKASLLSAVIPGAGQLYNRKYWKAPIVWGGLGVAIYYVDFNQSKYKMYRNALLAIVDDDPNTIDPFNGTFTQSFIEANMDFHRRYRDLSYVGCALVYALNIVDANIDAHFTQFDVSEDLSMHVYPSLGQALSQTPSLSVAFTLR